MSRIIFIASLAMLLSSSVVCQMKEENTSLRDILRNLGGRYDTYITVELGFVPGARNISLDSYNFGGYQKEADLESTLRFIRHREPLLDFERDTNSRILHVIDSRLKSVEVYPLSGVVTNFSFSGSFPSLVQKISAASKFEISASPMVDTRELSFLDFDSKVTLKNETGSIRSLLAKSITRGKRGRILWIADTEIMEKPVSYVRLLK